MALILPSEIISTIIECAAEIDYLDKHCHRHNIHLLPNLCLVSRLFYRLSSALIYRDVIVPAGWELGNIIKQLVPLLSLEQRRKLRESLEPAQPDGDETELLQGGELEDAKQLLVDRERIVDPACVKRLILWDSDVNGETDLYRECFWRAIDVAMADMAGLQYFHNEIGWDYPPLLEQLSTLQSIHHLGTGRADSSSRLELPLKCPLRSLSIFYEWFEEETVAAWSRILKESSSSLRALHLSFNTRTISAQSIDKTLPTLLTDQRTSMPIALPQLEELYLRVREEMPPPYWQSL
ncbi:uncharacterized protein H6S33_004540 [Morchella sextelata]|uniref:uncharacterized protein n=1 Tax=Morchella sextelata TaxID=1174677 RepID=UPI001D04D29A|nr:uncharacterized protein H6S33_004540 [Morchella sextelata]KAH0605318.1 hypothetical protein H6S33_004540 [Morchella sextelata]